MKNNLSKDWVKYGTICGLISAGTYMFLSVLMNIPDVSIPHSIIRIAFFSVGIFGVVSVGGLYHLIKKHKNGVVLQMALLLSIVTFAFFTLMAVIQETTGAFWQESLAGNQSDESINSIWHAVDAVQLGIDITFDIFYALTFILYSVLMFRHPRFGKIFSISGIILFSSVLILNLITFPHPPANKGLFDVGPFTGLWALVVIVQSLRSIKWMDQENTDTMTKNNNSQQ
jgi:hypothetical protein